MGELRGGSGKTRLSIEASSLGRTMARDAITTDGTPWYKQLHWQIALAMIFGTLAGHHK